MPREKMERLTKHDCMIILKAIYQMANVDSVFDERERQFFTRVMKQMEVQPEELKNFMVTQKQSIHRLGAQLSSRKAKRTFLLALAAMALLDDSFDLEEKDLLERLSHSLGVGKIKLSRLDIEKAQSFLLDLFSRHQNPPKEKSPMDSVAEQTFSDFDTFLH